MAAAQRECQHCKRSFVPNAQPSYRNPKKYCSQVCAWAGLRNEDLREKRICAYCKNKFTFYLAYRNSNAKRNPGKYCSKACSNADSRSAIQCARCDRIFIVWACMAAKRKYCSTECARISPQRRTAKICLRCGEKYTVINSQADTSKYCSFLCKVRYEGEQRRKPIQDPIPGTRRRLQGKTWMDLRDRIRERDGWACKRCGTTNGLLDVHHIVKWAESRNNKPSNLITLCRSCHQIVEPRGTH